MSKNNDDFGITPAALGALAKGDIQNFFIAAIPGGIEQQEADGQQQLVKNTQLPVVATTHFTGGGDFWSPEWIAGWETLKLWGIKFGNFDSEKDRLFIDATLPEGWSKVATNHDRWSILLDEQGRHRAQIFYKAAFYDRRANMRLEPRIHLEDDYQLQSAENIFLCRVIADKTGISSEKGYETCKILFETPPIKVDGDPHSLEHADSQARSTARAAVEQMCREWVNKHFPYWQLPVFYWNLNLEDCVNA